MKPQRLQFTHSVMSYIHLSLFTIIGITVLSIFFSFWFIELADTDTKAVNLSSTMRMQTFHISSAMIYAPQKVQKLIQKLDNTWNDAQFSPVKPANPESKLSMAFSAGYDHWFNEVRPKLITSPKIPYANRSLLSLLEKQVALTNTLVNNFQHQAESRIRSLRGFQLFILLFITLIGSLIFYLLKNRVEEPLSILTDAASQISKGRIEQNIHISGKGELVQLAEVFNQMSHSISKTYSDLEARVAERTLELQHNNIMLEFLFGIARKVLDNQNRTLNYHEMIQNMAEIVHQPKLELSLFTGVGEDPYLEVSAYHLPDYSHPDDNFDRELAMNPDQYLHHQYPIVRNEKQYGTITLVSQKHSPIQAWQHKLLRSTVNQIAIALSLGEQKDQEHRLAMFKERAVIARELHDSLAQSLSYLQIQATRLQRTHDKKKFELQQPILDELREGLSSAYQHLRELLTTFRLKMDAEGLHKAIIHTVEQLEDRSNMNITVDYRIENLPLSPSEEIHLLQITREACQNAINHSRGTQLIISLIQTEDKAIELTITDDGIGMPEKPEKLNHYGLAIIEERNRHLNGQLTIESKKDHGTRVSLRFSPHYLKDISEN